MNIGFDIGGSYIKAGLVSDNGEILAQSKRPYPGPENLMDVVDLLDRDLREQIPSFSSGERLAGESKISHVGISAAGSVCGGKIVDAYNLKMHEYPLLSRFRGKYTATSVSLLNDADAAAYGELRAGVFKGHRTAVLLTLGTGVGGGIILNGELFRGGSGHGTEPGHIPIGSEGTCTCGNVGCAEILCSARALAERIGSENAEEAMKKALSGDPTAFAAFNAYTDDLARFITVFMNLLDPEIIALGGGLGQNVKLCADVEKKARKLNFFRHSYKIVPAKLANMAGVVGAALYRED